MQQSSSQHAINQIQHCTLLRGCGVKRVLVDGGRKPPVQLLVIKASRNSSEELQDMT